MNRSSSTKAAVTALECTSEVNLFAPALCKSEYIRAAAALKNIHYSGVTYSNIECALLSFGAFKFDTLKSRTAHRMERVETLRR